MKLGAHIGIGRGLAWTTAEAIRLRCECIQIFLSNPRGWAPSPPDDESVLTEWQRALDSHNIAPVMGHSSYLVNLASSDAQLWRKSLESATATIRRGLALGADRFIVPGGYHKGAGEEQGRRMLAQGLRELSGIARSQMRVLIENTTGSGSGMNWRFEDMAATLAEAGDQPNLGICLDTCHTHVVGYDLSGAELVRRALAEFDRIVGLERLGAMHLNDAKYAIGSRRDAHTHIGRGTIGREGFRALMTDPRLADLPGVIETPKEDGWDVRNLGLLRKLRRSQAVAEEEP